MKLFLVGLPGSGKSTISKDLSRILKFPLFDTDEIICQRENTSIETIFQTRGENYFREYEQKVLRELLALPDGIISTGGGLPCFYSNMEEINQHGISIFLNVDTTIITERLWTDGNQNRPLLKGKNKTSLLEFLKSKLEERLPFYSKATLTMNGSDISADKIVEELNNRKLL